MNIAIYSDSQVINLEWIPFLNLGTQVRIVNNIEDYILSTEETRIAFTSHRMHFDQDGHLSFEEKVSKLRTVSSLVFVIDSELHEFHWDIWKNIQQGPDIFWLTPGLVNDAPEISKNLIYWGDWFKTTSLLYKKLPEVLEKFRPFDTKPLFFDALLGSPKPHRDFIYNMVKAQDLQDKVIMTYGGQWSDTEFYAKDYFIYDPGTEVIDPAGLRGTADHAYYHGHWCHLSQIIPIDVYNQTAYSIIAETDHDNSLSFFSEKTAKAIIGRRLFVAFTGYNFLANLRSLGFETFGEVINESYDVTKSDLLRYQKAFEQVKYLCQMPQQEILEKIRPVVEHNYNHLMTTDWTKVAVSECQRAILENMRQSASATISAH